MKDEKILDPIKDLVNGVSISTVNALLKCTELKDFGINKTTLTNVAQWALNGESDAEIRKHLDLNKNQWAILVTVCPTLLLIMKETRAMADVVIAGSLFQTAIGGKIITKQQPVKIKQYDADGKVYGEKIEIVTIKEELPPNPMLLKFLAENKLSEKFGENSESDSGQYKKLASSLKPEEIALVDAMKDALKKAKETDGSK